MLQQTTKTPTMARRAIGTPTLTPMTHGGRPSDPEAEPQLPAPGT